MLKGVRRYQDILAAVYTHSSSRRSQPPSSHQPQGFPPQTHRDSSLPRNSASLDSRVFNGDVAHSGQDESPDMLQGGIASAPCSTDDNSAYCCRSVNCPWSQGETTGGGSDGAESKTREGLKTVLLESDGLLSWYFKLSCLFKAAYSTCYMHFKLIS